MEEGNHWDPLPDGTYEECRPDGPDGERRGTGRIFRAVPAPEGAAPQLLLGGAPCVLEPVPTP